jgi:glycerol uptake facilitator-like aquaporin
LLKCRFNSKRVVFFLANKKTLLTFVEVQIKYFKNMKTLGYIGAFIGGAIAGAALGVLLAPEKGTETQKKLVDTLDDFCKKHNIHLSKKDVDDLVDNIKEATEIGE